MRAIHGNGVCPAGHKNGQQNARSLIRKGRGEQQEGWEEWKKELCATRSQAKVRGELVGADSPFFALLGSAPQELNNIRPEAKL
jgi:hypothetical protein